MQTCKSGSISLVAGCAVSGLLLLDKGEHHGLVYLLRSCLFVGKVVTDPDWKSHFEIDSTVGTRNNSTLKFQRFIKRLM